MGRPRKWKIHTLTQLEVEARGRFLTQLESLGTRSNIRDRLRQDWNLFLHLNGYDANPRSLDLFIADLALALSPSTAHEYVAKLSSLPAMKLPGMHVRWQHLSRLLNIRAADAETKRALDVDHQTAERILDRVANETDRNALRVMMILGLRAKDVTHLRAKQLEVPTLDVNRRFPKKFYRAEVRIAKNRKELGQRVKLYVPVEMRAPVRGSANKLSRFLEGQPGECKVFAECSTNRLNRALAAACEALTPPLPKITTYSLRRLYISEAIRYCKRNWEKVRELTLHFSADTIKGYYDKW